MKPIPIIRASQSVLSTLFEQSQYDTLRKQINDTLELILTANGFDLDTINKVSQSIKVAKLETMELEPLLFKGSNLYIATNIKPTNGNLVKVTMPSGHSHFGFIRFESEYIVIANSKPVQRHKANSVKIDGVVLLAVIP